MILQSVLYLIVLHISIQQSELQIKNITLDIVTCHPLVPPQSRTRFSEASAFWDSMYHIGNLCNFPFITLEFQMNVLVLLDHLHTLSIFYAPNI